MRSAAYLLLIVYVVIGLITIRLCDGTGDVGDSVMHYLYARSAMQHPELYFDHWAKPLFVLLASVFTPFGFPGIKLFNLINTVLALYFTWKIALRLNLPRPSLAMLFAACAPLYFAHTFSGLTEPMFAMILAWAWFLALSKRVLASCILVSFLPYVRSEGLIMAGVLGLYLMLTANWRYLPLLLTGSVVYGFAGYFVYGTVFWVFTGIPYATISSVYGSGQLLHFVDQLYYVLGLPFTILFWLGFLVLLLHAIQKRNKVEENILILLGFAAFFVAHSLFWYLGIFNSMGLKRVLLCIMPIMALVALYGFNALYGLLGRTVPGAGKWIGRVLVVYCLVFPFTPNPSALNIQRDLMLTMEQKLAIDVGNHLSKKQKSEALFIYDHLYFSEVLGLDHFDLNRHRAIDSAELSQAPPGSILIWENLYAEKKSGLTREALDKRKDLRLLYTCKGPVQDFEMCYALYEKRP
ncbi:MAG TPA: hypothetical protein PLQ93_07235 [Bacteroidia bacterium]|nr:hypothetical protein [Bacteroidia bacterium]